MRFRNEIALSFILFSFVFAVVPLGFSMTGAVIGSELQMRISLLQMLGLAFFLVGIFIFASRQTLDAIIIPTGGFERNSLRTETALKKKDLLKDGGYFVISGHYSRGTEGVRKSQDYGIYKQLREHGVVPSEMMVEGQSHDTLENVLYSLKKIKQRAEREGREGKIDVGVVTYSGHFKRFKEFHQMAVSRGLIKKDDFRLHEIPTEETLEDREYEMNPFRKLYHGFKLATMGKYKSESGGVKHAKPSFLSKWAHKLRDSAR